MRTHLLPITLVALVALVALTTAACSDDDGDTNQNNNTTSDCGDGVASGAETCDGADHRLDDCLLHHRHELYGGHPGLQRHL